MTDRVRVSKATKEHYKRRGRNDSVILTRTLKDPHLYIHLLN